MWEALTSGKVRGASGKTYEYRKNDLIDAPHDEFKDVPSLLWTKMDPDKIPDPSPRGVETIYPETSLD